jgi:hypothetical protein
MIWRQRKPSRRTRSPLSTTTSRWRNDVAGLQLQSIGVFGHTAVRLGTDVNPAGAAVARSSGNHKRMSFTPACRQSGEPACSMSATLLRNCDTSTCEARDELEEVDGLPPSPRRGQREKGNPWPPVI